MLLTNPIIYRGHVVSYDSLKKSSKLPLEFKCESCHKTFTTTKYQIVRNGHELCQPCAIRLKLGKTLPIGTKYNKLTVIKPSETHGYSICQCECGNVCVVDNYSLTKGHTRSCGCLQKESARKTLKSLNLKGEQHPNWKGGTSSEWSRITATSEYKQFRLKVLQRDNYTCQKCGSHDDLCTHHIHSFSANPSLRVDTNNAICLCRSCHEQFHRTYGKKHNNQSQIDEFLS